MYKRQAILTLNTIAHTVGAAGVGAQVLNVFGSGAVALASAILTFSILIFSEILPKTLGAYFCRSLAIPSAYVIRLLMIIAFPFVWLSNTLSNSINTNEDKVSREEITAMAEMGEDEGSIDEHESDIIENLFRLKEIQIEDILTPRSVIYAFEDKETVGNVMDSNDDIIFSRIPVFHENIDNIIFNKNNFKIVSKVKPSTTQLRDLIFAFNICRFAKSNAIVLAKELNTLGIGSGQPSRLDSCKIAIDKMNRFQSKDFHDIVAASDAFFPFVDGIEKLVQAGATAIVQPYGSIRDKEIIKFANQTKIALVFSKTRHFKH